MSVAFTPQEVEPEMDEEKKLEKTRENLLNLSQFTVTKERDVDEVAHENLMWAFQR